MRKILLLLVVSAAAIVLFLTPKIIVVAPDTAHPVVNQQDLTNKVTAYLHSKNSHLSKEEVSLLVEQKHWKLLIAISAIESQYCKRQLGYNCWGIIDGQGGYKKYENFSQAITDANNLIERWQLKGKWLTVESMNCSYVVPCNENWVNVVNKVIKTLNGMD